MRFLEYKGLEDMIHQKNRRQAKIRSLQKLFNILYIINSSRRLENIIITYLCLKQRYLHKSSIDDKTRYINP